MALPVSVPAIKSDDTIFIWNPLDTWTETEKDGEIDRWADEEMDTWMDSESLPNEGEMDEVTDASNKSSANYSSPIQTHTQNSPAATL